MKEKSSWSAKDISGLQRDAVGEAKRVAEIICFGMGLIFFLEAHGTAWTQIRHSMVLRGFIAIRTEQTEKMSKSGFRLAAIPAP